MPLQAQDFQQLLVDDRDVFSTQDQPLEQSDVVQHDKRTTGDPIKSQNRQIPIDLQEKAIKEEDKMKKLGVIEQSESPWAAPVVLVRKKDETLHYCIDYCRLTEVSKKDSYPLPNM